MDVAFRRRKALAAVDQDDFACDGPRRHEVADRGQHVLGLDTPPKGVESVYPLEILLRLTG